MAAIPCWKSGLTALPAELPGASRRPVMPAQEAPRPRQVL